MRVVRTVFVLISLAVICATTLSASAARAVPGDAPTERLLATTIESVVLYQGRAAVTRSGTLDLEPGFWKVRVEGLPNSIDAETLEAKASAGTILSVDFTRRELAQGTGTPEAIALEGEIEASQQRLATIQATIEGLAADRKFVDSIGVRAASDASQAAGSAKLDLAAVETQLTWISAQRRRLQTETETAQAQLSSQQRDADAMIARRASMGAATGSANSAEVLLALTEAAKITLRLSYIVTGARWEPVYSMRAAPDASLIHVDVDALVVQGSGEDWKGVRLSLSTARPSMAARPPEISPWFIDVITTRLPLPTEKMPSGLATGFALREEGRTEVDKLGSPVDAPALLAERLSAEATVGGTGPSVTYTIALPFDAPSDTTTSRRARIAAFDATTQFIYQTQPAAADGAFLRGTVTNSSAFQMLPGKASVFINTDYVGSMPFDGAAPREQVNVYFGVDPAVTVTRMLVKREDRASGLFGGGLDTVSNYRTLITNGTGREILIELLDYRPMSRNSKVEVALSALSDPLSQDPAYIAEEQPQGILRWDMRVPPTPSGSDPTAIQWTVTVSRSKDIEVTPLPDK